MTFYNGHSSFVNSNSNLPLEALDNSADNSLNHIRNNQQLIRNSTMDPTTEEFYPTNQSTNSNKGAVKRTQHYKHRGNGREKNNQYGSGRTFSSSKSEYSNKFAISSEEHHKILEETSNFLRNLSRDNSSEANQSSEGNHSKFPEDRIRIENRDYFRRPERNYEENRYAENTRTNLQYQEGSLRNWKSNEKIEKPNFYNKYEKNYYQQPRRGNSFNRYQQNIFNRLERGYNSHTERRNYNTYRSDRESDANGFNSTTNSKNYESNEAGFHNFRDNSKSYDSYRNGSRYDGKFSNDWRGSKSNSNKSLYDTSYKFNKKFDAASQRERLEEMLNRRLLECLVCCEKIKNSDKIWTCMLCYHILHLNCVAAWAKSSKVENGWRCPACQNVCNEVPKQYKCYCGKTIDPKNIPGILPHSCGEMCLRKGRTCNHKCTLQCHPGPCPDCVVMVPKSCGCGSTQPIVKCGTDIEIVCGSTCNKLLECGIHNCKLNCHTGECSPCQEIIMQECYCGKVGRKVDCTVEHQGKTHYACGDVCGKTLLCGNHTCPKLCHEGPCDTCPRDIHKVYSCPCGKMLLKNARMSCLDPIPCCDKICGKKLKCGEPGNPHICQEKCHEGDCPACPLTTVVRCRCGHMDKEISCQKLTTNADDARCEKKCTKKRLCGKHKCNQRCCIEIEHFCPLPCNHQLTCGQHRCERTCHSGRCPPCIETSFEELYCECGSSVIYPPVPCGTKPPNCNKPCSRPRTCGHEANHSCHTGPCPPCTVLTKRWCYGHHELRSAIPCHQENFSCGLPCGKEMPCGKHKCVKPCHDGRCPVPCKQPCLVPRLLCGHPCGKPCHDPPCPESSCKASVPITCACGLQKSTRLCTEVAEEFRNIQMAQLKDKMGALSKEQTVDISDISNPKKPTVLKILECTEECRVLERNRRLAIGLQIRNPDLGQKLMPRYSDYLKQWAKKDANFCRRVHDKLTELVQLAKQSKQKSRSYSFESMNRDKRHLIHEYGEHFGIETEAYDAEPNRNVVATAIRDKSWLPSMSLLEVLQRENGQRKVPGPISDLSKSTAKPQTVSLKLPSRIQRPSTPPGEMVDYFDISI